MGLFGIYAHGITEIMVMEKALIGLVACSEEVRACRPFSYLTYLLISLTRPFLCHSGTLPTTSRRQKWTNEALEGIGMTEKDLLEPAGVDA